MKIYMHDKLWDSYEYNHARKILHGIFLRRETNKNASLRKHMTLKCKCYDICVLFDKSLFANV